MSTQPETAKSNDEIGIILLGLWLIAFSCASLLALTPTFFISAILTGFALWIWGPANSAVMVLLCAASICAYIQFSLGYQNAALQLLTRYLKAFEVGGTVGVVLSYFRLLLSSKAWLTFAPLGAVFGASLRLLIEDRRKSRLNQLLQAGIPPKWRPNLSGALHRQWVISTARLGRNVTLGYEIETGKRVTISAKDANRHTFLLGTTGGGKTNSLALLLENSIRRRIATIFVDGKGEPAFGAWLCKFAEAHGVKSYFLDATGRSPSNCAYNPVGHGNATSKTDRLIALSQATHPYFRKLEIGYLQAVFKTLHFAGVETDLLTTADYLSTQKLLALVRRRKGKTRAETQRVIEQIIAQTQAEQEEIEGIRKEIQNLAWSDMATIFDTRLARKTNQPILSLPQARSEGSFVYVRMDKLGNPEFTSSFGKLVLNDIKATTPLMFAPWLTAFDEFHGYAGEQAIDLANMGRSFGIAAVFSTIAFADLERSVPHGGAAFVNQFVSAVNCYLFHQFNAPDDAELAARIIGTAADLELTAQMIGPSPTGATSARGVRGFREHPDSVKESAIGEAVFLNKNDRTVRRVQVLLSEWELSRKR